MRAARCGLLAICTAVLAPSGPVGAQQLPHLTAGQQVRVTIPGAGLTQEDATLVSLYRDTIVVDRFHVVLDSTGWRTDSTRNAVPLSAVTSLEVMIRSQPHVVRDGAIGGGVGALAGYLFIKAIEKQYCGWNMICVQPGQAGSGAAIGGVLGAGIGALIGLIYRPERWEPVALDRLHVTVMPLDHGGVGIGGSVSPTSAHGPWAAPEGLWFGVAFGWASVGYACSGCPQARAPGTSFSLRIGGTPTRQLRVGAEFAHWQQWKSGADMYLPSVAAYYYPGASGPFFIKGGVGAVCPGALKAAAPGLSFGLGADVHAGRTLSLTPYLDYMMSLTTNATVGGWDSSVAAKANILQAGLAAVWH